jgi:hypothetical protein
MVADLQSQIQRLEAKATKHVDGGTLHDLVGLQKAVDRAASEALNLAMGALARRVRLDDDACEEADLFIEWLSGRLDRRFARPTIPGGEDALHRATDTIRRRVPDHGLWDLPVMAHEFGHVVASGLSSWDARDDQVLRPVEPWLENFQDMRRSQATELFCVVFATYTIGPSYLCTLVFHRMDPLATVRASEDGTHPGDPTRVYACEWALRRMRGSSVALHAFDLQIRWARIAWEAMRATPPAQARLDSRVRGELDGQLEGCWGPLTRNLSALEYHASGIGDLVTYLESPTIPEMPDSFSPADALNAAWVARLGGWYEDRGPPPNDMEDRARRLIRQSLITGKHRVR